MYKSFNGSNLVEFLEDIKSRKEFNNYELHEKSKTPSTELFGYTDLIFNLQMIGIQWFGSQLFIKNFMNPNTPYQRILIKWQVGTGKSKAIGAIANEFIKQYKIRASLGGVSPSVFVVAFTSEILQDELLKDPAFGFATTSEIMELNSLKIAANRSGLNSEESQKYSTMLGILRRRITDKTRGGYYTFYGYKSFANRLFVITTEGEKAEFNILKCDSIEDAIKNKYVTVNTELLHEMQNSLLICDEIHNVYNIVEPNNYGIAIQYVLNSKNPPRAVFVSATPVTGAASEIVDLLNLLVPPSEMKQLVGLEKLSRSDLFTKCSIKDEEDVPFVVSQLKENALQTIQKLSVGRVSFLLDTNIENYPQRILKGEEIPNIPYLKFIKCPFSDFQEATFMEEHKEYADSMTLRNYSLNDFVFPNPETPEIGLYNSATYFSTLQKAPLEWRQKNGILIDKQNVTGSFLLKENIGKYSTKYYKLLELLEDTIKNDCGKIFIYHNRVRMTGVLLIQEILRTNGILSEHELPTDETICAVCGKLRKQHSKVDKQNDYNVFVNKTEHNFIPCRFVIVNSEIDKNTIAKSLSKFNSPSNVWGEEVKIIIGSKIIKEGFDFKNTRHLFILSFPINYPITIQVMGRIIRRNSHIDLPPELRQGNISVLVSLRKDGGMSPELYKYLEKSKEYLVIQEVDRVMSEVSIDSFMNYEKIKNVQQVDGNINILPYTPTKLDTHSTTDITFNVYDTYEVPLIESICKLLFRVRKVWSYDDLKSAVKTHVISNINYSSFDDRNFNIALNHCKRPYYVGNKLHNVVYVGGIKQFYICVQGIQDVECYLQPRMEHIGCTINISEHVNAQLGERNFEIKCQELERYLSDEHIEFILTDFTGPFQVRLIEHFITSDKKITSDDKKIIQLYKKFKIMIDDNKYMTSSYINEYDGEKWIHREYIEFNVGKRTKENDIIVGFVSSDNTLLGEPSFKLRPPTHKIRQLTDYRTVLRGIACKSFDKDKLHKVYEMLRNEYPKSPEIASCYNIKYVLLKLEEAARKESMVTSDRYLYLPFD